MVVEFGPRKDGFGLESVFPRGQCFGNLKALAYVHLCWLQIVCDSSFTALYSEILVPREQVRAGAWGEQRIKTV